MENVQKLVGRDTYTPMDASQVRGNCGLSLNREETLGVADLKTPVNSPDGNLRSGKSGQGLRVPVLNMRGEPLMPTTPGKARMLVEQQKATVLQRTPFAIQLLYPTGETRQDITLGIDSGYSYVGFSAVTEKEELVSGELELRRNISRKLEERRMYRRQKRNRLWHRQPRFSNRGKRDGWLAPSMEHKVQSHIHLIEKLKKILPITRVVIEVASFDTQKMQNPEIKGIEYQQGELQGYAVREYLLEKWGRKCAYCNKRNVPLEVEHIIPKSRGGTNRVSNLAISCHECNQEKGNRTAEEFGHHGIQKKAKKSLKATPFMNLVRRRIVDLLGCDHTYGYITKHNRIKVGLEKTHYNDAFVIAGGYTQERSIPYVAKQVRRNNRSIQMNRKGFKPSIRRQRYNLQPNDLVKFKKTLCRVKGVFSYGKWVRIMDPFGNIINSNIKKVEIVKYGKGLQLS